jgi:hypothetical protein
MFDFVRNESLIQVGADTQVTGFPNLPGLSKRPSLLPILPHTNAAVLPPLTAAV